MLMSDPELKNIVFQAEKILMKSAEKDFKNLKNPDLMKINLGSPL